MSGFVSIDGFSGGIDLRAAARFMLNRYNVPCVVLVHSDAGGNEHVHSVLRIQATLLRIEIRPIRMNFGRRPNASCFGLRAGMHREHIERLADRPRLLGIEFMLESAFQAAERMSRIRVLHADHIYGKLFVLNELHTRSLSRLCREISE